MPVKWVANMLEKAQVRYSSYDIPKTSLECCMRYKYSRRMLQLEAMQEKCNASNLYSISTKDSEPRDMQHFQLHWSIGEPVIVRDVFQLPLG